MSRDEVAVQRWLILGLALSITAVAATRLLAIFRVDGISLLEVALICVFTLLFALIAIAFWVACVGAHALWTGNLDLPLRLPPETLAPMDAGRPRTVLLVPVYNENVTEVFARIQAMRESLRAAGAEKGFDFFVLSDSTEADCRAAEDRRLAACARRQEHAHLLPPPRRQHRPQGRQHRRILPQLGRPYTTT